MHAPSSLSNGRFVALAAYEYILTLRDEQMLIWHRKWTASTWLFLANRYLMMFQVIQSLTPYTSEVGDCLLFSHDILLNCGFPVVSTMSDCPTFSDAVAYEYRCHATVLPFYVINLMPYIVFGGEYTCFLQVVYLLKINSFLRASCFCAVGPKLGVIRRRPDPEHTTFDNLCGQYLGICS